jgi:hypothetical protein
MRDENLRITYRHGRLLAAYYSFAAPGRARSHRTREVEPGLLVDFTRAGRPIGIEILDPRGTTLAALNRVMRALGLAPLKRADVRPLHAV